jgi:hypothetical protein
MTDILDILWPFDTFCVNLVHFSVFGIICQEKSGNPSLRGTRAGARAPTRRGAPTAEMQRIKRNARRRGRIEFGKILDQSPQIKNFISDHWLRFGYRFWSYRSFLKVERVAGKLFSGVCGVQDFSVPNVGEKSFRRESGIPCHFVWQTQSCNLG